MADLSAILKPSSQMDEFQIQAFLDDASIPLRLASVGSDGYPLVSSLWFTWQQGEFLCATHKSSLVARRLGANSACGFEIAADSMPYRGVRGQGNVVLDPQGAAELLETLFTRYDINPASHLATWLASRSDDEYVLRIAPHWLTSWDYTERMAR